MQYKCIPEQLRFGGLSAGKHLHGGQKKHYKDTSLKSLDIDMTTQETLAQNCSTWHGLVHQGCQLYEVRQTAEAQIKRELHKSRAISATTPVSTCLLNMCQDIQCMNWPNQSSSDTAHLALTWLHRWWRSSSMMMNDQCHLDLQLLLMFLLQGLLNQHSLSHRELWKLFFHH